MAPAPAVSLRSSSWRRSALLMAPGSTLSELMQRVIPGVADCCTVDLLDGNGWVDRVLSEAADAEQRRWLEGVSCAYPMPPDSPYLVAQVIRTGEPYMVPEVDDACLESLHLDPVRMRAAKAMTAHSVVVLPLTVRGRVLGSVAFISCRPERRYQLDSVDSLGRWAQLCALAIDNALLATEARHQAARSAFLADAAAQLSANLAGPESTLDTIARLLVPAFAEGCVIDLVENGRLRRAGVATHNPEIDRRIRGSLLAQPPDIESANPPASVIRTGVAEFRPEVSPSWLEGMDLDADRKRLASEFAPRSIMSVPLTARGQRLGAMSLAIYESEDRFQESDLAFASEVAAVCGMAIDNSHLYRQAVRALASERQEKDWMALLARLSASLAQPLGIDEVLRHLTREILGPFAADSAAFHLLQKDGSLQRFVFFSSRVPDELAAELASFRYDPKGDHVSARVLRTGEPVLVERFDQDTLADAVPDRRERATVGKWDPESALIVQLAVQGQALGTLSVTTRRGGRRFGERDLQIAQEIASRAALAIDHALLREEAAAATQALVESERRFRQLADSMPQVVWTALPDGRFDYLNGRWYDFTGGDPRESPGANWEAVLHPDDVHPWRGAWRDAPPLGRFAPRECRLWDRANGQWRWHLIRALPVRDEHGQVVRWFGTCTDIDEQKRVETELRRANQDLEQFAYSASHDLQEPLRNVSVYSQLLQRRYGSRLDAEAGEFLGYLVEGAQRMALLVSDLLAYTQAAARDSEPAAAADAGLAFSQVLVSLRLAIEESGARMTCDPLPVVAVKEVHLQQLLQNLVGNALKYRRDDKPPRVHVSVERSGGQWAFSMRDNGIGIAPEYHDKVFGVFKRLHAKGGKYPGTGIGLAICQKIVERYGGRIWVESEPGRGSTFHFTLPAAGDN